MISRAVAKQRTLSMRWPSLRSSLRRGKRRANFVVCACNWHTQFAFSQPVGLTGSYQISGRIPNYLTCRNFGQLKTGFPGIQALEFFIPERQVKHFVPSLPKAGFFHLTVVPSHIHPGTAKTTATTAKSHSTKRAGRTCQGVHRRGALTRHSRGPIWSLRSDGSGG